MKKIIIDGKSLDKKEKVLKHIKNKLNINASFANNLDGLWDVLSVYDYDFQITLINLELFIYNLKADGESLIELFNDLDIENENFTFYIK